MFFYVTLQAFTQICFIFMKPRKKTLKNLFYKSILGKTAGQVKTLWDLKSDLYVSCWRTVPVEPDKLAPNGHLDSPVTLTCLLLVCNWRNPTAAMFYLCI
ncbi:hypothetical protein GOODEAATRI_015285 [Goodea atripinnis]|uniref:Uncharacterized protein n=1 Tax=Goodea atripinnis TaxID=208336 RepID=A0ABV0P578_9TELE